MDLAHTSRKTTSTGSNLPARAGAGGKLFAARVLLLFPTASCFRSRIFVSLQHLTDLESLGA